MAFFDTFSEFPPTSAGRWLMERQNRHHLSVLRDLREDLEHVVEIGPGLGAFAATCRSEGLRYLGVEPNHGMGRRLHAAGHDVIGGLVPPMPLAEGSVDVVHAAHVIEHSPTFREGMEFVRECRRVVRGGGLVSILAPDFDHLGDEFYRTHYSHSLPINMRRLTQLMRDNALEIRHAEYLSGPFRAPLAWLTQSMAWLSTPRLIWLLMLGRLPLPQCYSAKMTFMRAVWVVGQRGRS